MTDFSSLLKRSGSDGARLPKVISLPISAWVDSRSDRPTSPVDIGIRLLSEEDTQIARSSAAKIAIELVPVGGEEDRIAAFNDALMRFAAERGTCSPKNVEDGFFPLGELEIRQRLTPEGVRRIWQEIEALHLACNPSLDEIDDEGLAHLFALLDRERLSALPRAESARVRRLLELCRTELASVNSD